MRPMLPCLLAATFLTGCTLGPGTGKPLAPPFSGRETSDRFHSMLDITKRRQLLVVFVAPDCKQGEAGMRNALKLQQAVGEGNLAVLAVVAIPVSAFDSWRAKNKPPIPSIPDADRRIMQVYKAEISPTFQLIGRGGTLESKFEGLDALQMEALGKAIGAPPEKASLESSSSSGTRLL